MIGGDDSWLGQQAGEPTYSTPVMDDGECHILLDTPYEFLLRSIYRLAFTVDSVTRMDAHLLLAKTY